MTPKGLITKCLPALQRNWCGRARAKLRVVSEGFPEASAITLVTVRLISTREFKVTEDRHPQI